mmetsp:Transcript_37061/g.44275  ORF Transcript_37061/g.44275 Transcript_37061/m.44275 type:complete len:236 (+) Transcript_37061:186-893(+)
MLTMRLLFSAIVCIPNFAVAAALQNVNTNTDSNPIKITPMVPASHRRDFLAHTLSATVVATFPTRCTAELSEWQDPRWTTLGLQGTAIHLRSIESAAHANTIGQMALYPDPILRRTASPVTNFNTPLETVTDLLLADMKSNAITALQYGIDARIIALKGPASPTSKPLLLINPTILTRSGEEQMQTWNEYCLVLPPTLDRITVLRDEVVEVAAQDVRGVPIRKALRGAGGAGIPA